VSVDDSGADGGITVPFDFTSSRQEVPTGTFAEEEGSEPNTGISSPPGSPSEAPGPQSTGRESVPGTGAPFPAAPPMGRP
jgi:hypothetical protein